jgi:hypothetical protein
MKRVHVSSEVNRILRCQLLCVLAVVFFSANAWSQLPQVVDSRLGVDSVKIDGGQRLYGFLLAMRPDRSIQFSVERKWLEKTHPKLFVEFSQQQRERAEKSRQQRIERIEVWLEQRRDDRGLAAFLEHELARFRDATPEDLAEKKFVSIELASSRYRELSSQPADRRQIAGLAFQYALEAVTTTPVTQLKKQLIELGVDTESEAVNLSKEVEASSETERQWCARKAIVEHLLRQRIEYQGSGTMMIRKSEGAPDASALVAQMLDGGLGSDPISQLGAELGLPEFKKPQGQTDRWWKRATEEAERDGFCGVALTRLNQNALSSIVSVENYFFAMERPGSWFLVTRVSADADSAEQTADQLKRIQEDPQVKSILDTLKGLGLGNQALVEQALGHGAATQQAMQVATGLFNAFLTQHSRELDSPPIALAPLVAAP